MASARIRFLCSVLPEGHEMPLKVEVSDTHLRHSTATLRSTFRSLGQPMRFDLRKTQDDFFDFSKRAHGDRPSRYLVPVRDILGARCTDNIAEADFPHEHGGGSCFIPLAQCAVQRRLS